MADEKIEISIEFDDGSIKKGFASITREAKKSSEESGKSFQTNLTEKVSSGLVDIRKRVLSFAAGFAAIGTAIAGSLFSKRAVEAAAAQEESIKKLNTSLKLAGTFSREASQGIQDFATEMQNATRFGDELIIEQVALARNFTKTNDEAKKLVSAAVDLSEATGVSLDTAVTNLGKSYSGLVGRLGESVPIVRTLTAEQLKNGEAVKLIAERFGGAAAENVSTFSGRMEQLGNVFGDLLEAFGRFVTKSPAVLNAIGEISSILAESVKSVDKARESNSDFAAQLISAFGRVAAVLNSVFLAPLEVVFRTVKLLLDGLVFSAISVVNTISRAVFEVLDIFDAAPKRLADFIEENDKVFLELQKSIDERTQNLLGAPIADAIAENLGRVVGAAESAGSAIVNVTETTNQQTVALAENIKPVWEQIKDNFNKFVEETKTKGLEIGQFLVGPVTSLVKNGVARIGASLVQGGNAFEGFGQFVLGILGDFLINLGFAVTGIGKAAEAVKLALGSFNGVGAIAAGLTLIALGGAIKAFAGGLGGLGTAGTAGTGSGEGGAIAPGTTQPTIAQPVTAAQGPQIQVQIQGNVLDRRETGLEIVRVLQESFDFEGAQVIGV